MDFSDKEITNLVQQAIREDKAREDITSNGLVDENQQASAEIITREPAVAAGLDIISRVYDILDMGEVQVDHVNEGSSLEPNQVLAELKGPTQTLLAGERVAVNFTQHLSGIATLTNKFVQKVTDYDVKILDTRKTTPGWRKLEKYAVRTGGGDNHRMDLSEMSLVKENHLFSINSSKKQELKELSNFIEEMHKDSIAVELEVDSIDQLEDVLYLEPDYLLLDNMAPRQAREAVKIIEKYNKSNPAHIKSEISGGVGLDTVEDYAKIGVDRISIGRLTHSASASNFSFQINKVY